MNWVKINYLPNMIKRQYTTPDLYEQTISSIKLDHGQIPSSIDFDINLLIIDPGGIILNDNNHLSKIINGYSVSIKPEHIITMSCIWNRARHIFNKDDEKVFRIYLNELECLVINELMYKKTASWLAENYPYGLLSVSNIKDKLEVL